MLVCHSINHVIVVIRHENGFCFAYSKNVSHSDCNQNTDLDTKYYII